MSSSDGFWAKGQCYRENAEDYFLADGVMQRCSEENCPQYDLSRFLKEKCHLCCYSNGQ